MRMRLRRVILCLGLFGYISGNVISSEEKKGECVQKMRRELESSEVYIPQLITSGSDYMRKSDEYAQITRDSRLMTCIDEQYQLFVKEASQVCKKNGCGVFDEDGCEMIIFEYFQPDIGSLEYLARKCEESK